MRFLLIIFLCLAFFFPATARTEIVKSQQARFRTEILADKMNFPWCVAFLPNGEFLITERGGKLLRVDKKGGKTEIQGMPTVYVRGQAGLFDVALAPDFEKSHWIFFAYMVADENRRSNVELARARLDLDKNRLSSMQVIFKALPKVEGENNNGGRILLTPDHKILLSVGDRFKMDEAQNLQNHLGKLVRLNLDGTIPNNNPFVGRQDAKSEIYTYGNRNIQGIAIQPGDKQIWMHEHGPKGGDEVNIVKRGANYGWPKITYGIDYDGDIISEYTQAPGMEDPLVYWVPSIAPSGMAFYHGNAFPKWKGDLFLGALAGQHLRRLEIKNDRIVGQEVLLQDLKERIRDVRNGPDGYLYLLTDSSVGKLIRLVPARLTEDP